MADRTLNLAAGNRNRAAIDPANVSLLSRLRGLTNVGAAPSQRALNVTSGDDVYEPTEAELIQQQLAPMAEGGGTFETPGGYATTISRDKLREAGTAQFKRRLRALSDQYIVPEQVKGATDIAKQQLTNKGNVDVEQLKGENAVRTAAVPRTVNQTITTGTGAGGPNAASQFSAERAQRAIDQVDYLLPKVSGRTAGLGGTIFKLIPGSGAKELESELTSLKSNIAFNELNEMRAASKTGGALGQVSDTEERMLSQALGGLDQANDPVTLRRQLERVKEHLQRWDIAKRQYGQGGVFQPNGLGLQVNVGGGIGSDPYGLLGEGQ